MQTNKATKMTPSVRLQMLTQAFRKMGWKLSSKESTPGVHRVWMKLGKEIPTHLMDVIVARVYAAGFPEVKLGDSKWCEDWLMGNDWSVELQETCNGAICIKSVRNTPAGERVRNGYDA